MNKARRKALGKIQDTLREVTEKLETIREAEQEAYDAMSEQVQEGDKGTAAETAIAEIENAMDGLEYVIQNLDTAMGDEE